VAQRFTPLFADAARFARRSPDDRWHVDETYAKTYPMSQAANRRSFDLVGAVPRDVFVVVGVVFAAAGKDADEAVAELA
jgi:hypothetical protein